MKILQVITSLRVGGAENLVTEITLRLKKRGHDVDVFVFDGIRTHLMVQLEKNGVHIIRYNNGGSVYNPQNIMRLIHLISKYDIIHTHNSSCQYFAAIARNFYKCSRVKFITTEHSANNRRRRIFLFKLMDRWMYRKYDSIVGISDKATENLIKNIGNTFDIKTIYNGVDLERFVKAKALTNDFLLKKTPENFVITMVAGFREEKDQDTLIRSLQLLPKECVLWLIGDGVRRTICEKLVQSLCLTDRVVFAGVRADIPNILKSTDVVVMSSHYEGLSLSSIEGMSVGKPFVASDVDGLHEIVYNFGLLFPVGNYEILSRIILKLKNDSEYATEVAKNCFVKASLYGITKCVTEYESLYKDLYSSKG